MQYSGHSIINDVNYGGRKVGNIRLKNLRKKHPLEDVSIKTLGKRQDAEIKEEQIKPLETIEADDNGLMTDKPVKKLLHSID